MSQSTSMLYNYIQNVFTTWQKNTPQTLTSSVRQLWANLCTWPRHAQKRARPGRPARGHKRRQRSGLAPRAKMWCSLGLTFKAGMLSNSQKDRKKKGKEGGRKRGDMCLSLRNSSGSNLHIYDHSPEWAHCERRTTTTKSNKIKKKNSQWKKWFKEDCKEKRTDGRNSSTYFQVMLLNIYWSIHCRTES